MQLAGRYLGEGQVPSNNILHSFLSRRESSSSLASMALDRFLFSSSSPLSVLILQPILGQ